MKLGENIVKYQKLVLIISLILIIPAVIGYKNTKVNYDMLTYLPKDMETVKGQDMLMEDFGNGGFSIIVVEDLKTDQINKIKEEISNVENVSEVINVRDVLNPNIPKEMLPKSISKNINNEKASMMAVFFKTSTSDEKTLEAVEKIRKICDEKAYVSGLSALVLDLKNLSEEEEPKYAAVAVVLSLAAMMFLLDSYLAPVLFLISIGMAIIYNLGTNLFLGEISYITKSIAAVLQLGVTMDYSIFLWHSYIERKKSGMEENEAMAKAIDDTLVSVTGSSITTIAGFLALCFMTYTMGKDLGLVMAKGVVFGVISSITILPVLILKFKNILNKTMHKPLIPDVHKLAHGLTSRYYIYIIAFVLLLIPAFYGYKNQNIVYDFTKMLSGGNLPSEKVQFLEANKKLSEYFNINTSYMVIADSNIEAKNGKQMVEELKNTKGISSVLGLDSAIGTSIPKEILPDKLIDSVVKKGHQLIIVNSEYKVSTDECNEQINKVNEIVKKYDKSATVIGEGPATQDLIKLTNKDFEVVNEISIAMVFIIILFVLRSISLPILLISVIEFAIIVNLGIPGFTKLELPFIVPICISTIQLGSTVDYAILMSTRYKKERKSGKLKREAIIEATAASIPSIIVSALGFFTATIGVAIYSKIGIISTMCKLMARGAIISMLTVILALPSFLMLFDKFICKTTRGLKHLNEEKVKI